MIQVDGKRNGGISPPPRCGPDFHEPKKAHARQMRSGPGNGKIQNSFLPATDHVHAYPKSAMTKKGTKTISSYMLSVMVNCKSDLLRFA